MRRLWSARSRLDPAGGAVLSAVWVPGAARLALIIHHLAVDGVSWRILLEDMNIAWAQHRAGQPPSSPAAGTSFQRWAEVLARARAAAPTWRRTPERWRQIAVAPVLPAVPAGIDTFDAAGRLSATLDVETARTLLGEAPQPSTPGCRTSC